MNGKVDGVEYHTVGKSLCMEGETKKRKEGREREKVGNEGKHGRREEGRREK